MNECILTGAYCTTDENIELRNAGNDDKKRAAIFSKKINRIYHKVFEHCNVDMPDGKVLHLGRTLAMNYAKDNDVDRPDIHSMSGHKTGDTSSQVVEDHYYTCSPPSTMHVMSGATDKKEWKLGRACCSTHNFESMVYPKISSWIEQRESFNGDKTKASYNFLNYVLPNDARVIAQDGKMCQLILMKF